VALALLDIDGFRALNARRGPRAGDDALAVVAERVRGAVRAGDVLGRTGADDVAVLMPGTTEADAHRVCERIIAEIEGIELARAGFITVSAGVAAHQPGMGIAGLLAAAGRGLDRARAEGGARAASRPATKDVVDPFRAQAHVIG